MLTQPHQARILNKFEQTPDKPLPPGFVLRLVEPSHLLSDGITSASRCQSLSGATFFIFPEQEGWKTFKRVIWIGDTVLTRQSLTVTSIDGQTQIIAPEEALQRVFRFGRRTFISGKIRGWVKADPRNFKKLELSPNQQPPPGSGLQKLIRRRINDANRNLRELADFFYRRSGQRIPAPQWQMESTARGWTIRLKAETTSPFEHSRAALKVELQRLVAGTPYRVQTDSLNIHIGYAK